MSATGPEKSDPRQNRFGDQLWPTVPVPRSLADHAPCNSLASVRFDKTVTPPPKSVTVDLNGRPISLENQRVRDWASSVENVTVHGASREDQSKADRLIK